jgi:hypothetical protein
MTPIKCEKCRAEHYGEYGAGRFCSSKCARSFSTRAKRADISQRVREKLKGRDVRLEALEKQFAIDPR